jgi:hypothetical protein
MSDPALARLEAAYKEGGKLEAARLAWVAGLLQRELIKGSEVQFMRVPTGPLRKGEWWFVEDYRSPEYAYVMPGVYRLSSVGWISLRRVHKSRRALLNHVEASSCTPEFIINHLADWRPSGVVVSKNRKQ